MVKEDQDGSCVWNAAFLVMYLVFSKISSRSVANFKVV
jgi:hypothetical protein